MNSVGKELCDILVVCDPHVVLISVKHVTATEGSGPAVDWERWARRAIQGSAKQLYGAERELTRLDRVTPAGGGSGLPLPPGNARRVHRVAVAMGSGGNIPFVQGDLGKGFVHVLDETAAVTVLNELDTITDFVEYLDPRLSRRSLRTSG